MKPSSSPSEPSQSSGLAEPSSRGRLFDPLFGSEPVTAAVSDRAFVQAMLDAEAALARAQARVGLLTEADAVAISACCDVDRFDVAALGRDSLDAGNPAVPLVRALTAAVTAVGSAAGEQVHRGATSQDIVDTALMLVAHRASAFVLDDLDAAARTCAELADAHRTTLMAGRTLLQQALPITFGLKAAGWLVALTDARSRLAEVRQHRLAVQFGGAAGTMASLDPHGVRVLRAFAHELGLAEPVLPWHTDRTRLAELSGALAAAAGVAAKIAGDVVLLAQTEVAEATEAGGAGHGGSSSLPHKANPVGSIRAIAAARRVPGLLASMLAVMDHEHERAAGGWHAEWETLTDLLRLTGGAVARVRDLLPGLRVDAASMRANLDATHGLLLAERVTVALASRLGRGRARSVVDAACRDARDTTRPLGEVLAANSVVSGVLDTHEIAELLDPAGYLGASDDLITRALRYHRGLAVDPPRTTDSYPDAALPDAER